VCCGAIRRPSASTGTPLSFPFRSIPDEDDPLISDDTLVPRPHGRRDFVWFFPLMISPVSQPTCAPPPPP
jgi:hypothetical protein